MLSQKDSQLLLPAYKLHLNQPKIELKDKFSLKNNQNNEIQKIAFD